MLECLLVGAGIAIALVLLVLLVIAPVAIAGRCSDEEHWMKRNH